MVYRNTTAFTTAFWPTIFRTFTLCLTTFLISSCVTTVSESSRNKDQKFDGQWRANVAKPASEYRTQNWRISCNYEEGSFTFRIKDGEASVSMGQASGKAYVNDKGKFRVIVPIADKVNNNVANSGSLTRGINIIVDGDLDGEDGSGRYTQGYESLGNQGCNSKIAFAKL